MISVPFWRVTLVQYVTPMLHIFHFSSACSSIKGLVGTRGGTCHAGVHVKGILAMKTYKTSLFKVCGNQKSRCLKMNAVALSVVRPLPVLITLLEEPAAVHQDKFTQASNPPSSRTKRPTYPNEDPKNSQQHSTRASQVRSTPPKNHAAHPPHAALPRRARECAVAQ